MKSQSRTPTALSTLIDYDHATGHTDPTAQEEDETEAENEIESGSGTIDAKETARTPPHQYFSKATQGWTATIPEPDLTKKPS
jgi:hypothetical protein